MKHIITAILLLSSSIFAFAEGKIAVVNFEEAVFNTDRVQAKAQELQEDPEYKKNMDEAKAIQEEGKKLMEKLQKEAPTMSREDKQKIEAQVKSKQSDMEYVARKLKEAEEAAIKPLMFQMRLQAMKAAQEIVDAEGIGLLLNASAQSQVVLHADTSFDITAKVTDKLNKLNNSK